MVQNASADAMRAGRLKPVAVALVMAILAASSAVADQTDSRLDKLFIDLKSAATVESSRSIRTDGARYLEKKVAAARLHLTAKPGACATAG